MNISAPPDVEELESEEAIRQLAQWCRDVYKFLQYPVFHKVRLYPWTSNDTDPSEGDIIYNSTDDKFRGYTTSFEDFN